MSLLVRVVIPIRHPQEARRYVKSQRIVDQVNVSRIKYQILHQNFDVVSSKVKMRISSRKSGQRS